MTTAVTGPLREEADQWFDAAGRPQWDRIDFAVRCARCDYDLQTITEPRCPECGLTFDWRDMLETIRFADVRLFEHACYREPFRSFVRTCWRVIWFPRFWRRLSVHIPINVHGLLLQCFLSIILGVGGVLLFLLSSLALVKITMFVLEWAIQENPRSLRRVWQQWSWTARIDQWLESSFIYQTFPELQRWTIFCVILAIGGFFVFVVALRQTMGRFRVRTAQIIRVYANALLGTATVCVLLRVSLLSYALLALALRWQQLPHNEMEKYFLIPITFGVASFAVGLRRYLQLPQAWLISLVGFATAVIFSLTITLVCYILVYD